MPVELSAALADDTISVDTHAGPMKIAVHRGDKVSVSLTLSDSLSLSDSLTLYLSLTLTLSLSLSL